MLKPGDLLVPIVTDKITEPRWKAVLVISIDRGQVPSNWTSPNWRAASVLLLTADMSLETRDFSWITRSFKHA